jgi:uncharacterized protein YunC (DUF1805 family)
VLDNRGRNTTVLTRKLDIYFVRSVVCSAGSIMCGVVDVKVSRTWKHESSYLSGVHNSGAMMPGRMLGFT